MHIGKQTDLQAGMRAGEQTSKSVVLAVVEINGEVASQIRNHSPTACWFQEATLEAIDGSLRIDAIRRHISERRGTRSIHTQSICIR